MNVLGRCSWSPNGWQWSQRNSWDCLRREHGLPYMMNGKEVQRAFRGHLMVDQCITQQIVSKIVKRYSGFQELVNELETLYLKLKSNEESLDIALQSECIHKIDKILNCTMSELSKTSALWINYQRMLSIARAFIAAD